MFNWKILLIFASMLQIPIESLNLQMLNVGLARHEGDWNWQNVESPFTRIFFVKEGEAKLCLPQGTITLRPAHLYIIPAYTKHSYVCDGHFVHYYLHVYEGFKSEMNLQEQYDFPTEVPALSEDELILKSMCEQHPQAQLPVSDPQVYDTMAQFKNYIERYRDMPLWQKMELRGAILVLFSHFMREAKPHVWTSDDRIRQSIDYIHSHITEELSMEDLASVACVTKPYFIRLFKQEIGTSPLQYVNSKKVERAQLLLYTTDMPVKEVAYTLGFSDHSYFIRMFRKMMGITPQDYRYKMRGT